MKKLLAVILLLCMLMPCAVAEDVTAMSDDALKALYIAVKEELMARKLWDEATLPAGVYVAGKGLPEGTYECTATSNGLVKIYKNYDDFAKDEVCIDWFSVDEGEKFTMTLYGDICYFVKFNSTVRPFTGLSW